MQRFALCQFTSSELSIVFLTGGHLETDSSVNKPRNSVDGPLKEISNVMQTDSNNYIYPEIV